MSIIISAVMSKRVLGAKVKVSGQACGEGEVGQVNEALAKVLCHNICALNAEVREGNTKADFQAPTHLLSSYHINSHQQSEET